MVITRSKTKNTKDSEPDPEESEGTGDDDSHRPGNQSGDEAIDSEASEPASTKRKTKNKKKQKIPAKIKAVEPIEPDRGLADVPSNRPIQTDGQSTLPLNRLRLIEYKLYHNMKWGELIDYFHARADEGWEDHRNTGDENTSDAAKRANVSKKYMRDARTWFQEQSARRPWELLHPDERKLAKACNKSKANYPLIDPASRRADHAAPVKDAAGSSTKRRPGRPKKPTKVVPPVIPDSAEEDLYDTSLGDPNDILNHGYDQFDIPVDLRKPSGPELLHRDMDSNAENITTEMDKFCAMANRIGDVTLFTLIGESSMETIRKDALVTHCSLFTDTTDNESYTLQGLYPEYILRAFIECISPILRDRLPGMLFNFYDTDLTDPLRYPDEFRIVHNDWEYGEDYDFMVLGWNMQDSFDLFRLALELGCDHVKDLTISRMHWLYEEITDQGRSSIRVSKERLAPLTNADDIYNLPTHSSDTFLRFWADMMNGFDRGNNKDINWEEFGPIATAQIDTRKPLNQKNEVFLHGSRKRDFCFEYHHHEGGECTIKKMTEQSIKDINAVIASIYEHLRETTMERYRRPIFYRKSQPRYREVNHEILASHGRRQLRRALEKDAMMQSLEQEARILKCKLRIELGGRRLRRKLRLQKDYEHIHQDNEEWYNALWEAQGDLSAIWANFLQDAKNVDPDGVAKQQRAQEIRYISEHEDVQGEILNLEDEDSE
ncbi:hypothetical protein N0V90_009919 [Kalmusia sp. IMI 367209]|nr:hypothetical protein N0V90_009919 [Kalmusia sp. IMI 367209]